jgi:hypothetical protein
MSLINLIEEISAVAFPIAISRIAAVALFEKGQDEPDSHPVRLTAHLNDQQVLDLTLDVNFQGQGRTRMVAEAQGMPITNPGELIFVVSAGETMVEVGRWIINVKIVGAPKVDLFTGPSAPVPSAM